MKINMRTALVMAALIGSTGAASAQTQGDWVLARYKGGAYWYPGVIQGTADGRITVGYDDGDRETLSVASVRPYTWAVGSRVECNFQNSGKWYPGVIASLGGESLGVNYDDGDRERTKTGRCRSR